MMVDVQDFGEGKQIVGNLEKCKNLRILFRGNNNTLHVGEGFAISGNIEFHRNNCRATFAGRNRGRHLLYFKGDNGIFSMGKGSKTNATLFVNLAEPECRVKIGESCLFAGVKIRPSDSHKILDRASGIRLNPVKPILIDDRVWLAEDCIVLGGSRIGSGSVVGARSLVSGEIPPNSLAVGSPARVIREDVEWVE